MDTAVHTAVTIPAQVTRAASDDVRRFTPADMARRAHASLTANTKVLRREHKAWDAYDEECRRAAERLFTQLDVVQAAKPLPKQLRHSSADGHSTRRTIGGENDRHVSRRRYRSIRNQILSGIQDALYGERDLSVI